KTNRGRDITYHGPGQIGGYPVLDLESCSLGVKSYISKLEESIIKVLEDYELAGQRLEGATGVWLDPNIPGRARKICAIGVKASRHITMHGFAFNVNTDLKFFEMINPCGFTDKLVTSLQKELGKAMDFEEIKTKTRNALAEIFGMDFN
ncbi:MAG: lipoyl(octanoyl) transferase LipB, partial [Bacteroidales bacterium]|nr:lipoyl(octanoyl) transferase LipB [Bacteroidales bacterium]